MSSSDKELGLDRPISRRDFLDGAGVALGSLLAGAAGFSEGAEAAAGRGYPPAATGMRGAHAGSFEALHRLREGNFWSRAPRASATGETYDLVVVGAGISGLAAAWTYAKARPGASILILDNHDDFGGHAKRNEFRSGGAYRIGYGGSQSISSPLPYSPEAKALVAELGVRVDDYAKYANFGLYRSLGLSQGFHFSRELFGEDKLVRHGWRPEIDPAFVGASPLSETARRDLARLTTEMFDPFPGEAEGPKRARLARISYAAFLNDAWKVDRSLVPLFDTRPHQLFGVGIDAVPAQDAHGMGLPGFQGMGLVSRGGPGQNYDSMRSDEAASYFFHFPDGNATLARLLVRKLIPSAMRARGMEDSIPAVVDYPRLDRPGQHVRIRLNSSVVRVRHLGKPGEARRVAVTYQRGQRLHTVRARRVVLACWHTAIPFICDELGAEQRAAMAFAIKVPVVYTNVLVRNWQAWEKLGVSRIVCPGFWHTSASLDFPVSMGRYRFPRSPSEPIVIRMAKAACSPGLPARDQHRAGRRELYGTAFETIERRIRDELNRMLGAGGFDAARDILGITVNRWPHGYSYQYNSLYDDFWLEGRTAPCEIARRPFGRIAVANADAGAYAYADGAIDHGIRAAREALSMR